MNSIKSLTSEGKKRRVDSIKYDNIARDIKEVQVRLDSIEACCVGTGFYHVIIF